MLQNQKSALRTFRIYNGLYTNQFTKLNKFSKNIHQISLLKNNTLELC